LSAVSPETLQRYSWVMNDIVPSPESLPSRLGYSVRFKNKHLQEHSIANYQTPVYSIYSNYAKHCS